MRVTLVSSSSGSHGGGEFYLHSLALGLRALGHDVTTIMSQHSCMDELADRFTHSMLPIKRWPYCNTYQRRLRSLQAAYAFADIRRITDLLRAEETDIVHLNQQCVEDGLDLVQAAADSGIPAVSTIHVTRSMQDLQAFAGGLRDRTARRILGRSGVDLVAISNASRTDLSTFLQGALPDRQVHSAPNGVARPVPEKRSQLHRDWEIPEDSFVIGCVARIEQQKNPLFAPRLLSQLPDWVHFVWLGDGRLRKSLEDEINNRDLQERFHLPGWHSEAASQMVGFDLFALPSHYEGLPLALLEAMSLGLPCIASAVDGMADVITSGSNGVLCQVGDVVEWQQQIMRLLESHQLRSRLSENALNTYSENYSLEAMARRTSQIYETVIARSTLSEKSDRKSHLLAAADQ
ncbi:glycosyltransferase family 4 protein [bacterium]|nr:glycosyltransferase family 4 protein [bacterium]